MYDIYFDLNNMHQAVEESDKVDDDQFWIPGEQLDLDLFDESKEDDYPVIVKTPSKKYLNGCTCRKCGDLYPYAEPNQSDGTFKCWSCRNF